MYFVDNISNHKNTNHSLLTLIY